ncbi:MAG: hypothetical protein AB8H79_05775 [Myxococcota bacterium]
MPGRSRRRSLGPADAPEKEVTAQAMTRLTYARAGIDHTKGVLPHGAGNQLEALRDTNFNSYFRMAAMRDMECWELDSSVADLADKNPEALTAAMAELAQGGNCGEHATIAYDFLRMQMGEDTVNMCDKSGLDHAFLILGNVSSDSDSDLAVCDPWPTSPTSCLWEDHFAYDEDRTKLNVRSSVTGNTEDVKSAISSGLRLSAKGEQMIQQAFDDKRTEEEIKSGTEGDKPWIWEHGNAASETFQYVQEDEEAKAEQTATDPEYAAYQSWLERFGA